MTQEILSFGAVRRSKGFFLLPVSGEVLLMKKILISVVLLGALMGSGLWVVSRLSDSYALAAAAILGSKDVAKSVGTVQFSLLLGSRHKIRHKDVSNGEFTFLVKGGEGVDVVEVFVRRPYPQKNWEVCKIAVEAAFYWGESC